MSENDFMARAMRLAAESIAADRGGPFGAVIVRGGEIIAEGWNEVTSTNDPTAHAEMVAIRRACDRLGAFHLNDCDIYASCEPCPMCLGAIYWARIRRIYFANTRVEAARIGFSDAFIYQQIGIAPAERSVPAIKLSPANAEHAFAQWMSKETKTEY